MSLGMPVAACGKARLCTCGSDFSRDAFCILGEESRLKPLPQEASVGARRRPHTPRTHCPDLEPAANMSRFRCPEGFAPEG